MIQISKFDNLKDLAKRFDLNPKTLYNELVHKSILKPNKCYCNKCLNRYQCKHFDIEIENTKRDDLIKENQCDILNEPLCTKLKKFPYVCNYCENKFTCKKLKRYYDPKIAQETTDRSKSDSRMYTKLDQKTIKSIDNEISPRIIDKGQSLNHIYESTKWFKNILSYQTLKRYLYKELFKAKPHNLPDFLKFPHVRKSTIEKRRRVNNFREDNRSFNDFIEYKKSKNIDQDYWEYDSIEGKKSDSEMILTITYVEFDFQFGIVYEKYNPNDVLQKLRFLQNKLGEKFWQIFKLNLADNGVEFTNFSEIEFDEKTGEIKCKTFYTRPNVASDKGDCECNHKIVRRILPKFKSYTGITQEECNEIFSHVNALIRKSKQNKTPYELFVKRFGLDVAEALGIRYVSPRDVSLKPFSFK